MSGPLRLALMLCHLAYPALADDPFVVRNDDFGVGGTTGTCTIEIDGTGFDRSVTAQLDSSGGSTVPAEHYYRVGPELLYATFNLTPVAPGVYDVIVTKHTTSQSTRLQSSLTVVAGGGPHIELTVVDPDLDAAAISDGDGMAVPVEFQVVCFNSGINDAYVPLTELQSNCPFYETTTPLSEQADTALSRTYATWYPLPESGGSVPGRVLPNRGYWRSYWIARPGNDSAGNPNDGFECSLGQKYSKAEEVNWMTYLNLHEGVGPDNLNLVLEELYRHIALGDSDFHAMLSRNACLLDVTQGGADLSHYDLMRLEIDRSLASVTTSISGMLSAPSFDIPISHITLTAYNHDTGDSYKTTSWQDGSFAFHSMSAGSYEIFTERVLPQGDSTRLHVAAGEQITGVEIPVVMGNCVELSVVLAGEQSPLPDDSTVFVTYDCGNDCEEDWRTAPLPRFKQLWHFEGSDTLTISGLPDGQYKAIVDVPGFAEAHAVFTVGDTAPESIGVTIECVPGFSVAGTVCPDAAEVTNKTAILERTDDADDVFMHYAEWHQSDFSFPNVLPGTYKLSIAVPGYATVIRTMDISGQDTPVDLGSFDCVPERTLTVRWVGDWSDRTESAMAIVTDSLGNGICCAAVQLGVDFELGRMGEGQYTLCIFNSERVLYETRLQLDSQTRNELPISVADLPRDSGSSIAAAGIMDDLSALIEPIDVTPISVTRAPRMKCDSSPCGAYLSAFIKFNSDLLPLQQELNDAIYKYDQAKGQFFIAFTTWAACIATPTPRFIDLPCDRLRQFVIRACREANRQAFIANGIQKTAKELVAKRAEALEDFYECEVKACGACQDGFFRNPLHEVKECISCQDIEGQLRMVFVESRVKQLAIVDAAFRDPDEAYKLLQQLLLEQGQNNAALGEAFERQGCAQILGMTYIEIYARVTAEPLR